MFMHIICMSIKQISVSVTDLYIIYISAGINVFLEKPEHINDVGEV